MKFFNQDIEVMNWKKVICTFQVSNSIFKNSIFQIFLDGLFFILVKFLHLMYSLCFFFFVGKKIHSQSVESLEMLNLYYQIDFSIN